MSIIRLFIAAFIFSPVIFSCESGKKKNKKPLADSSRYDLENPVTIKLPDALAEVSGIVFYPKDSSLFAIKDEAGILYKIFLNKKNVITDWRFDKKKDYEDLVLHDSIFYVLISNGDIETIQFGASDSILTTVSTFPEGMKNEFEAMYYDDSLKLLILLCKDCNKEANEPITIWGYDIVTNVYSPMDSVIDLIPPFSENTDKEIKLRPSAAAINPVTNELYILASINKLLLVADRKGKLISTHELDSDLYPQPEGIAFTPWGDLIITNELVDNGRANILVIKNKKRKL
ncbi:SdiA-regulated domain-containing protein [Lacibacter sp. H375]|uniref:SdiA-regulated domain-containing protein n=1 Tax=Lacibacter sp. H375 TaxID=3133424 RepID=UPI0030C0C10C